MSDLRYNTTTRARNAFVRRDPHDALRLIGYVVEDIPHTDRQAILDAGTVTGPAAFCRPPAQDADRLPSFGAYHIRTPGEVTRQKKQNPHGEYAHGNLLVGRKKLVDRDIVRGFREYRSDASEAR